MSSVTLLQKVAQFTAPYAQIVVALSGGLDSTVLLHLLCRVQQQRPDLKLRAQHINHAISPNATSWAEHCRQLCQRWQIAYSCTQIALTHAGNLEAEARQQRYQALKDELQAGEVIALAHHLDDQAETFLLALKRGSGPTGLAAMAPISQRQGMTLLRPLLAVSRSELVAYAQQHALTWIEDESNQVLRYDRNFLRQAVLPTVQSRWPQFNRMLARSAQLCGEQQQLLDELLQAELQPLISEQGGLILPPLLAMSTIKRQALLRLWLKQAGCLMPQQQQLQQLWQDVALAKADANPQFVLADKQIRRFQSQLWICPKYAPLPTEPLDWPWPQTLKLPQDLGSLTVNTLTITADLRAPTTDEQVTVRFAATGRYQIIGHNGSRSLKKLWQELKVPPWLRSRIPLIFYNQQLICAVGYFITEQGTGADYTIQHCQL